MNREEKYARYNLEDCCNLDSVMDMEPDRREEESGRKKRKKKL